MEIKKRIDKIKKEIKKITKDWKEEDYDEVDYLFDNCWDIKMLIQEEAKLEGYKLALKDMKNSHNEKETQRCKE